MHSLALQRNFQSSHFLVGGDWGAENELHSHDYRLEIELTGAKLNEHGFLVDLVQVEKLVDKVLDEYVGQTLNERPEFEGLNPSIEHFSRILCQSFERLLDDPIVNSVTVRIWEDEVAWASYHIVRQ